MEVKTMIEDKHNQNEEYMSLAEIIYSIIFFATLFGGCWLFLLITYQGGIMDNKKLPEDIRKSIELLVKIIAMQNLNINMQTAIKQQIDDLRNKITYMEVK